ncbi:MAG: hypothetical protein NTW58_05370 [Actinobacteria bacterium]|nr:hypothetical protein [Actinomycetota bacterium]
MTCCPAGSTVQKFIGDAMVGIFGAPAAHEDDLECTVRAAGLVRALGGLTRPENPCTEPQECAI